MLDHVKRIFPFGNQARIDKFAARLQGKLGSSALLAMQNLTDWLNLPATRLEIDGGGLALLQSTNDVFRGLIDEAMQDLIAASNNQAKTTLLLRALVPYCALLRDIYGGLLSRDILDASRRGGNVALIQAAVGSWLFWNGRCFFVRFLQDGRPIKLPWHEIQPTATFALGLDDGAKRDGDAETDDTARLRRQLASLVLLSRSLSTDLQGRQLLIAERIADSFADHTRVSTRHGAETPFGHANNDDNPPTVLSQLPTRTGVVDRGLFYGLDESLQELVRLDYQIKLQGSLPTTIDPAGQLNVAEVVVVITHLRNRWSGQRIKRQAERRSFSGTLAVVHGVDQLTVAISPQTPVLSYGRAPAAVHEPAEIVDASLIGLGIKLTRHTGWIKVGQLVGLKMDSEPFWRVGMVRRAVLTGHREVHAGVQLVGREPQAASLRRISRVGSQSGAKDVVAQQSSQALFVRDEAGNGANGLLISASSDLEIDATYALTLPNQPEIRFRVGGIQELGSDCILYFGQTRAA
jgi:hypothetical protein